MTKTGKAMSRSEVEHGAAAAPPVCQLAALGSARARHRRLLAALLGAAVAVRETRRGWELELPSESRWLRVAAAWVTLERRCCPFVDFRVEWNRRGRLRLAVESDPAGREALVAGLRVALEPG